MSGVKGRRHSQVSASSTFECISMPTRGVQTPVSLKGEMKWQAWPPADMTSTAFKVRSWWGHSFISFPCGVGGTMMFVLPLADRRWLNVGRTWGSVRECYPVITSARFLLAKASFPPTATVRLLLHSAEALSTPFVQRISHLYSLKSRGFLLLFALFILILLYAIAGIALNHIFVYTVLMLIVAGAGLGIGLVCIVNRKLRKEYHGLALALGRFALSPQDIPLKGCAVTAFGPFALHFSVSQGANTATVF